MLYELGKVALLPLGDDELAAAKRYAAGTLALSTATSAGLASTLSMLAGSDLGPDYLREHSAALGAVDAAGGRRRRRAVRSDRAGGGAAG